VRTEKTEASVDMEQKFRQSLSRLQAFYLLVAKCFSDLIFKPYLPMMEREGKKESKE